MAGQIGVVGKNYGLMRGFISKSIGVGQTVTINTRNSSFMFGFSPYHGGFMCTFGYKYNSLSLSISPTLSNLISITKKDNAYSVDITNTTTSDVTIVLTYIDYNDAL